MFLYLGANYFNRLKEPLKNEFVTNFLKNLSIVFIFKVLAYILNILTIIIAARELGTETMGDIAVVTNMAGFLLIPLVMGINSSMNKYLPVSNEVVQKEMISTTLISLLPLTLIFLGIYYVISQKAGSLFGISHFLWQSSVVMCTLLGYSIICESFLRGQKKYLQIGMLKLIFAGLLTTALLLQFYVLECKSIHSYLTAYYLYLAMFILSALYFTGIKKFSFNRKVLHIVYPYGFVNMVGWALNTFLTCSDLFFVKYFCNSHDVGVYAVYQSTSKTLLGLLFNEILAVVFLPTIASMDRQWVYKKVLKFCIPIFIIIFFIGSIFISFAVYMYGRVYELNLLYVAIASAALGVIFIYQLLCAIMTMEGKEGTKLTLFAGILPIPLIVVLQYIMTKLMGIMGTLIAIFFVNLILLVTLIISARCRRKKLN